MGNPILDQINVANDNLLRVAQFNENNRRSKLTEDLMQSRENRDKQAFDSQKVQLEASRIKEIASASDPDTANRMARIYGVDGVEWMGDTITLKDSHGNTWNGPRGLVSSTMGRIGSGEDMAAVIQEYQSKGGVLQPKEEEEPKNFEELFFRAFQNLPPEMRTEENTFAMMERLASVGKDTRTPEMKNAEALTDPDVAPEFKKQLGALLAKQKRGTSLSVSPDGTIEFISGDDVNPGRIQPTSATQNKLQEKIVDGYDRAARLDSIVSGFKPGYLTVPDKLGYKWTELKEAFKIGSVPDKDLADLEEFSRFRQDSLENINLAIKEITGAQMSEKEAKRIRQALPDPGEGVLDGDSPTEFRSKLVNSVHQTKLAIARYNYLSQGLGDTQATKLINDGLAVSLADMEKMMDERFEEYKKDPKYKNDLNAVGRAVAAEFGLVK